MANLPTRPIKVILVDDQKIFRRRLRQLVELAGWIVIAEAGDISTAECLVQSRHPDIALVDVYLPGVNGFEGTMHLKALDESLKIYLISAYANLSDQFETLAKAAGAEAFVSKEDLDLELIRSWSEAFWMDCSTQMEENS
jgi:DNA-binding NarL/FixJ family response regulator